MVETEGKDLQRVHLSEPISYTEGRGALCLSCTEGKVRCAFAEGKTWNSWKMDYIKRHLNQEVPLEGVRNLRRFQRGNGINHLLMESNADRKFRFELNERRGSQA